MIKGISSGCGGPQGSILDPFLFFSFDGLVGLQEQSAAPGVSPSNSEILFFSAVSKPSDSVNAVESETLSGRVHDTVIV